MERDDKKVVSRLVLISGFIWLVFSIFFANKLCYAFYESGSVFYASALLCSAGWPFPIR